MIKTLLAARTNPSAIPFRRLNSLREITATLFDEHPIAVTEICLSHNSTDPAPAAFSSETLGAMRTLGIIEHDDPAPDEPTLAALMALVAERGDAIPAP